MDNGAVMKITKPKRLDVFIDLKRAEKEKQRVIDSAAFLKTLTPARKTK
jgi:hypothetical protein